jgi:lysozyme
MPHVVSPEGIALLKRLEGFRPEPLALGDGRVVVGYGHVEPVAPTERLTEAEAEVLLRIDLAPVEAMLAERLLAPVSQPQFDALASFAFSIGTDAFLKSDVLRRFNAGEPIAAACAMDAWRKSRIGGEPAVLDALVRRRAAEKAVFLDLTALVAAPSAFLRPEIDHAAAILGQPTRVLNALPAPPPRPASTDDLVEKLAAILGGDPNTAHALRPPPVMASPEEEEPLLLDRPVKAAPQDVTALALFGIAGAALLLAGLIALSQRQPYLFLLLAAPGAAMLAGAAWRLLKDSVVARLARI